MAAEEQGEKKAQEDVKEEEEDRQVEEKVELGENFEEEEKKKKDERQRQQQEEEEEEWKDSPTTPMDVEQGATDVDIDAEEGVHGGSADDRFQGGGGEAGSTGYTTGKQSDGEDDKVDGVRRRMSTLRWRWRWRWRWR